MEIVVDGKRYEVPPDARVVLKGRTLYVNGKPAAQKIIGRIVLEIRGGAANIDSSADVEIRGDVSGSVNAGRDVKCQNVSGSVNAGRDVKCASAGRIDSARSVR